MPSAYRKLALS